MFPVSIVHQEEFPEAATHQAKLQLQLTQPEVVASATPNPILLYPIDPIILISH